MTSSTPNFKVLNVFKIMEKILNIKHLKLNVDQCKTFTSLCL